MVEVYALQKIKHAPLKETTRQDASAFRDHLLEQMKPNSVLRNVAVVKAAVNFVITEHRLTFPNVFKGLRIKGQGPARKTGIR